MAKMTTEKLRTIVAEHCLKNFDALMREFTSDTSPIEIRAAVSKPKNWVRIEKRCDDNDVDNYGIDEGVFPPGATCWVRVFDCRPLDDQLRAYVVTDPDDVSVISIDVER